MSKSLTTKVESNKKPINLFNCDVFLLLMADRYLVDLNFSAIINSKKWLYP